MWCAFLWTSRVLRIVADCDCLHLRNRRVRSRVSVTNLSLRYFSQQDETFAGNAPRSDQPASQEAGSFFAPRSPLRSLGYLLFKNPRHPHSPAANSRPPRPPTPEPPVPALLFVPSVTFCSRIRVIRVHPRPISARPWPPPPEPRTLNPAPLKTENRKPKTEPDLPSPFQRHPKRDLQQSPQPVPQAALELTATFRDEVQKSAQQLH
jgi:hypothetical protein